MGFKIPSALSSIVQVAAPAIGMAVGGPLGASVGMAVAGGVGAIQANKDKKAAQAQANAFRQQQMDALNQAGQIGQAQADKEVAAVEANKQGNLQLLRDQIASDEKFRDEQVAKTEEQVAWVAQQLQQAKEAGDKAAEQRLSVQLDQIQKNLDTVKSEAQAQAAQNKQTLQAAEAKEQGLIQSDITSNRALRAEYGDTSKQAMSDIGRYQTEGERIAAEQAKLADQVATWKAAAMSDMDAQYRDLEENERRKNAAKGQTTPRGVNLAIAIAKARDKGALKASLDKQEMDWKAQNLAQAANSNAALSGFATTKEGLAARRAGIMEENSGEKLANLSRFYSNAGLQQDETAGARALNAMAQAGEKTLAARDTRELTTSGNQQALTSGLIQNRTAGNAAIMGLDQGLQAARGNNLANQMTVNTNAVTATSNAQRFGVGSQQAALTGNASIFGTGAANALDAAKASQAAQTDALKGVASGALDIGKWVGQKYGGPKVDNKTWGDDKG